MTNLYLLSGRDGFYKKLRIQRDAIVAQDVMINLDADVDIGQNVSIGPRVVIYTGSHPIGPGSRRMMGKVLAKPVKIEDGSWIGLGAMILPGVTVGRGSIVAAGSVVAEDVPPNAYVAGNPAQVVRQLPWGDR